MHISRTMQEAHLGGFEFFTDNMMLVLVCSVRVTLRVGVWCPCNVTFVCDLRNVAVWCAAVGPAESEPVCSGFLRTTSCLKVRFRVRLCPCNDGFWCAQRNLAHNKTLTPL